MSHPPPDRLDFCCELAGADFEALCVRDDVCAALGRLNAGVCVGLVDLDDARGRGLRRLQDAGIRTSAWLLLPREDGYWHHAASADATLRRFEALREFSDRHGLTWRELDLDFEPAWAEMHALTSRRLGRLLGLVRARLAAQAWQPVLDAAHADGWRVASFVAPLVLDDRRAGGQRWRQWLGVPDLALERERVMLYSSLLPRSNGGFLSSYAPECRAIAVGSTGGGIAFDGTGELRALSWDELARDLRIARAYTGDLTIFSLEGCARRDWLARLADLDWSPIAGPSTRTIDLARWLIR